MWAETIRSLFIIKNVSFLRGRVTGLKFEEDSPLAKIREEKGNYRKNHSRETGPILGKWRMMKKMESK